MAWTFPRTWVAGESVTAALLNTHLRDNLRAISQWTAYTPTWGGATAPALGNGTITGQYILADELVFWRLRLVFGSTTTLGTGTYTFSLPVAGDTSGYDVAGHGFARDDSASAYMPLAARLVGSNCDLVTGTGSRVNPTTPFAWAAGDSIGLSGMYVAA